ncbi:MAG: nicotinate-nucleotide--dimethylbenzimidazole phosphoribosyltransferase [Spirochaetota bacterium]
MRQSNLNDYLRRIRPVDRGPAPEVQARLDSQTKPPGSLGRLEELVMEVACIQGTSRPSVERKLLFTMAADHGVVEEGVSAFPQSVTAQMVQNFLSGGAAVNVLARHAGCTVVVVDMGVAGELALPGLVSRKIAPGTANFTRGPAMTREQAEAAVLAGIELALEREFDILGTGEMGIGNTTPSAAVAAVVTGIPVPEITGRGTGVDDRGLARKIDAVQRGIRVNRPDPSDPLDVLAKVGGFEIGGIAGLVLGAAAGRRPVVVDGFISTAGALLARALCPEVSGYMLFSHRSAEQGHDLLLRHLGARPILDLGMRLGEGTGAALAVEVIDAALALYDGMATFDQAGVDNRSS